MDTKERLRIFSTVYLYADKGEGVKNPGNFADVLYVRTVLDWLFLNCSSVITVSSRSCSGAPSISEARCSGHVVNALRTEICLCGTNGCNGLHNHEMNIEGRNLVHSSGQGHFNPIKRGMFVGTFVVIKVMLWFTRFEYNTRFSFRSKHICALIHSSG